MAINDFNIVVDFGIGLTYTYLYLGIALKQYSMITIGPIPPVYTAVRCDS